MVFSMGFSQESLADQVRVLVKTASSEETIVLKPEVTEHEFHDLIPAAGAPLLGFGGYTWFTYWGNEVVPYVKHRNMENAWTCMKIIEHSEFPCLGYHRIIARDFHTYVNYCLFAAGERFLRLSFMFGKVRDAGSPVFRLQPIGQQFGPWNTKDTDYEFRVRAENVAGSSRDVISHCRINASCPAPQHLTCVSGHEL